jgi:hypothetical protein
MKKKQTRFNQPPTPSWEFGESSPQHEPSEVLLAAQMLRQGTIGDPLATALAAPEGFFGSAKP